MPEWFIILAKVLTMLARLIPLAETTFQTGSVSGSDKKQWVTAQVTDFLDSASLRDQFPAFTDEQRQSLLTTASATIDEIVEQANQADAWTWPRINGT